MKLGRPRSKNNTKKQKRLRKQWRVSSTKYYKKNRKKVLRKARVK